MTTRSLWTVTRAYIGALGLVALLSIVAHLGLMVAIVTQNTAAATVNISGRQRMLSQRIALLGQQLVTSADPTKRQTIRAELQAAIDLMSASHAALINGDRERRISPPTVPAVNALYFDAPTQLDAQVRSFLAAATSLAQAPDRDLTPANPDLADVVSAASAPLLTSLDQAVQQYQLHSEAEINRLRSVDNAILVLTLAVLTAEALLIFRPLARRIATKEQKLHDAEAYTRSILDHAPHGILTADSNGRVTSLNPEAARLFGYPAGETGSLDLHTLFPREVDHHGVTQSALPQASLGSNGTQAGEAWGVRADGRLVPVEWSSSSLDRDGQRTSIMVVLDRSERSFAERSIQRERDFARQILNSMGQGLVIADNSGRLTYVNPAYARLVGYEPEALIGKLPAAMLFPEDKDRLLEANARRLRGEADTFEIQLRRADDTAFHALITVVPHYVEGEVAGAIAVISNLSERKRTEQRLRNLYDVTASWHLSFDQKIQTLLEMGCREFDLDIGVLTHVADQRYTITHAVDRDAAVEVGSVFPLQDTYCAEVLQTMNPLAIEDAAATGWTTRSCYAIFRLEAYIGAPVVVDGDVYGTLAFSSKQPRSRPFTDGDKEFLRLMAHWVSGEWQRQQAEYKLQASEAELRALFSAMTDVIVVLDRDGRYLEVAPTGTGLLLGEPDHLTGKLMHDIMPPHQADAFLEVVRHALSVGHTVNTDYNLEIDGSTRWFSAAVSPMTEASVLWVARDMSERKQAQELLVEALAAVESQYYEAEEARRETRAVLDATSEAIVLIAPTGEFLTLNRQCEAMFGVRTADFKGRTIDEVWPTIAPIFAAPDELRARMREVAEDLFGQWHVTVVQRWPEARELDLFSTPVMGGDGVHRGRLYVFRDVTREREVDRMKSEFVSLVSHELRTPMTSIKGYVDLLLDNDIGPISGQQRECLEIVQTNSDRLIALINELLDVSRIESGKIELLLQPINLRLLVGHVVTLLRLQIEEKGQTIHFHADPDLPLLQGDHDRLTQIVTNLLSNAHKYTPVGGAIIVRLRAVGTEVLLDIKDNGIGLTTEEQKQLFTKFFRARNPTTQRVGGTGLGLTIVRSLVELHGGTISVRSTPDVGSTFTVHLPIPPDLTVAEDTGALLAAT